MTRHVAVKIGPIAQRRLYGWAAVASLAWALFELVVGNTNGFVLGLNLALSFQALWKTTVVEVKTDPDIVDPSSVADAADEASTAHQEDA